MKKLQVLFFALAAILFIGTAQTATAQKRKPNKRTTTTSPRKKPTTTTQATINVNFKGELGLYELRGPVKQCIWKNDDSEYNLGFDNNGMWVTENGEALGGDGIVIKRDKAGRIIKRGDPYDEEYTSYTYNSNGLVTKKSSNIWMVVMKYNFSITVMVIAQNVLTHMETWKAVVK